MLILSSTPIGLELWSVNYTLICENSESKVCKNIKFFSEISNDWPNGSLIMLIIIVYNITMD